MSEQSKQNQKVKVLVADDDKDILTLYRMSLKDHYQVIEARDGWEAWKLFQEEKPRLIVTDLNMPGHNGLEFIEKIREHDEGSDVPIIVITGTTVGSDLPAGFWKIGTKAQKLMEKPIEPDELLTEVKRQLLLRSQPKPLPPGKGYYEVNS